jgi:hypothetical protein
MSRQSLLVALVIAWAIPVSIESQRDFTLGQVRSYPFPSGLTAAATGSRLAWTLNERGQRNVDGPEGRPSRRAGSPAICPTTDRS